MKVIHNRILPFGKKYYAINLFGVIFAKGPCNPVMLNHEAIHTAQMRELLYIPFYILYVAEWIWLLIKTRNPYEAYSSISFEKEAYANERNPGYLKERKKFSSFRY
ncbi:MAG: hypothetical protein K2M10_01755 [Muribaculaceae bacterium]|nr:hypothetical protein [Muribaculaceae bacterium]